MSNYEAASAAKCRPVRQTAFFTQQTKRLLNQAFSVERSLPRCDPSEAVAYFNNFLYTVYKTHNSSLFTLSLPLFVPILPPRLILSQPFHHEQPAAGSPSILPLAAHLFVFRRNVNDSDSGCGVWRWNLLKRDRAVMDCECAIVCLQWVCWRGDITRLPECSEGMRPRLGGGLGSWTQTLSIVCSLPVQAYCFHYLHYLATDL